MRKLLIASLLSASVFAFANVAAAQTVSLEMDQSKPIKLRETATGVVVGNAGVADVIVHDPKVIIILGKSVGETHVLVLGQNGKTLFSGDIVVRAGQESNILTVQRGKEIQTSLCRTRCIDVVSPESSAGPMQDAAARAKNRDRFTSGN